MPKEIKQAAIKLLKHASVLRLFGESAWRHRRLLILGYHGISLRDEHEWNPPLYLSAAQFRSRMELLRLLNCTVIPLREGIERLFTMHLPPRSIAITFDDGAYDFCARAHPILREYGYHATLYLTTYYCEHNAPVFNLLWSYLLWKRRGVLIEGDGLAEGVKSLDLRTPESRQAVHAKLTGIAAALSLDEKGRLAERLAKRLQIRYEEIRQSRILHLMNAAEVTQISGAGVDVQLHTHRHRAPMEEALFVREIRDNRARIEKWTGSPANHFCYPSGMHDPRFLPWLKGEGIVSAVTCEPGLATPKTNALLLPRLIDVSGLSGIEFEGWLSGASTFLPRRRAHTS
jgi:peptidoglycan/xylan/chitin deacetylase (PgdA/CDA1 family)